VKVWIDIENPPQVQYLLPFRRAFEGAGIETVVTTRDYGSTVEMLARAGVDAPAFGVRVGTGKLNKVAAAGVRARDLSRFFGRSGRPDAVLAASRAAAIAARAMRIPSFLIGDYEHVNMSVFLATGSTILHPDVIGKDVLRRRGLRLSQLVAFKGLKEDLTFADVDVDAIDPHDLGPVAEDAVRVLFRPPSETSHYYNAASTNFARATLAHLASADALVVFSPRDREQVRLLEGLPWRHRPLILERPVPFVSLLKSVDLVVCSGGTMLREAAYLGIPSYGIFQSKVGAVDRWLEDVGRAKLLVDPRDLRRIELGRRGPLKRLDSNPELLDHLVSLVALGAGRTSRHRGQVAVAL
jgi:predicted glycosyltransferase